METNADNLKSIVEQGHEMARAGHFDSDAILKAVKDFDKRSVNVHQPPCTALCVRLVLYHAVRTFRPQFFTTMCTHSDRCSLPQCAHIQTAVLYRSVRTFNLQ